MGTALDRDREGLAWQTGIWDRIADRYVRLIDSRFTPVVDGVLGRAGLRSGGRVLDLGTGTGSVAVRAAPLVAPDGEVVAVDISSEMLARARRRATAMGVGGIVFREGRAEALPAPPAHFDAVLASLSLMYVIDRGLAAREIARVLRPGGRLVAAAWAGPERCDIVRLQQAAGSVAPAPPVPGVGPGALADPSAFVVQLRAAGIETRLETETTGFDFPDFASAWDALAGVTTAQLPSQDQEKAQVAVRTLMWPGGDGPRHFTNLTQFIVGERRSA